MAVPVAFLSPFLKIECQRSLTDPRQRYKDTRARGTKILAQDDLGVLTDADFAGIVIGVFFYFTLLVVVNGGAFRRLVLGFERVAVLAIRDSVWRRRRESWR
jgi:hypothetical protein